MFLREVELDFHALSVSKGWIIVGEREPCFVHLEWNPIGPGAVVAADVGVDCTDVVAIGLALGGLAIEELTEIDRGLEDAFLGLPSFRKCFPKTRVVEEVQRQCLRDSDCRQWNNPCLACQLGQRERIPSRWTWSLNRSGSIFPSVIQLR